MLFKVHNQELACCSALLDTFDAAFASVQPCKGREEVNVRVCARAQDLSTLPMGV